MTMSPNADCLFVAKKYFVLPSFTTKSSLRVYSVEEAEWVITNLQFQILVQNLRNTSNKLEFIIP